MSTEYKQALQAVDETESLIGKVVDGSNADLPRLDQLLRDTNPLVAKLRGRATDPNTVWGPKMCTNVVEMADRWTSIFDLGSDVIRQRAPELAAASAAAAAPAATTAPTPASSGRAPWMAQAPAVQVPSPAQMDASARPALYSNSTGASSSPSAAQRREQQARAAEARLRGAGSAASTASTTQAVPATQDGGNTTIAAPGTTTVQQVGTMEGLVHLVHRVFLGHEYAAQSHSSSGASSTGPSNGSEGVVHRVLYTHEKRRTIIATYVPVQHHLVVYAQVEGDGDLSNCARVALCLGMAVESVYAKADYLLVSPLTYRFCVPSLPRLPLEVSFTIHCSINIPALAMLGCASKQLAASIFDDDILWWRVLLNLPQTDQLQSFIQNAVSGHQRDGQVLPAGESRRIVRKEVERVRAEQEARRRAREDYERAMRDNPLMRGPRRPPGQPFPGGPFFGGGGIMGGDHDLMPGGMGNPFGGGGRRGPFGGGGGGGFGPRML